jgi:DNA-binding NarL/FixJ family response regulator
MFDMRLLVADDHAVLRAGLKALLEAQPGWKVEAEAADGREAVAKARELRPDIAVIDISMPLLNGLEATRQILKNNPRTKVLILTMHESDTVIREVLDAGAKGYVLKTDAGRDVIAAVGALWQGKPFFTSRVAQLVLNGYLKKEPPVPDGQPRKGLLTPRQREIVQLIAEGKTSKELAAMLNLSVKTAETHRANIMRRLSCHSVSDLVRYAIRNEMVRA